jgi:hypothetical protein
LGPDPQVEAVKMSTNNHEDNQGSCYVSTEEYEEIDKRQGSVCWVRSPKRKELKNFFLKSAKVFDNLRVKPFNYESQTWLAGFSRIRPVNIRKTYYEYLKIILKTRMQK